MDGIDARFRSFGFEPIVEAHQLRERSCAGRVAGRGTLYAPDVVVNAGSGTCLADPEAARDPQGSMARIDRLVARLKEVLDLAAADGPTTTDAAERLVERRISGRGRGSEDRMAQAD